MQIDMITFNCNCSSFWLSYKERSLWCCHRLMMRRVMCKLQTRIVATHDRWNWLEAITAPLPSFLMLFKVCCFPIRVAVYSFGFKTKTFGFVWNQLSVRKATSVRSHSSLNTLIPHLTSRSIVLSRWTSKLEGTSHNPVRQNVVWAFSTSSETLKISSSCTHTHTRVNVQVKFPLYSLKINNLITEANSQDKHRENEILWVCT